MITTQLRTAPSCAAVDQVRPKPMERRNAIAKLLSVGLVVDHVGMIMKKLVVILILMSHIETILL